MKRRDMIRMFPITFASAAGMAGAVGRALAADNDWDKRWPVVEGEPLAKVYSKRIRERLTWVRENQSEGLMEAAHAIADTVAAGGQCYQTSWDAGHTESDSWPGRNGEPDIFSTQWDLAKAKKGDLLLTTGQTTNGEEIKKKEFSSSDARARGAATPVIRNWSATIFERWSSVRTPTFTSRIRRP